MRRYVSCHCQRVSMQTDTLIDTNHRRASSSGSGRWVARTHGRWVARHWPGMTWCRLFSDDYRQLTRPCRNSCKTFDVLCRRLGVTVSLLLDVGRVSGCRGLPRTDGQQSSCVVSGFQVHRTSIDCSGIHSGGAAISDVGAFLFPKFYDEKR